MYPDCMPSVDPQHVVVAMSGGVDSSAAALLLARAGHRVTGVTLRLYDVEGVPSGAHQGCCTLDDIEDARRVCAVLGIPHYVMDAREGFRTHVMDYFVAEYRRGRTPHPCIACNDRIKFDLLAGQAEALGAGAVATGHYARIAREPDGSFALLRGVDQSKDQSYVLAGLGQAQLARTLLPVGSFPKTRIRALAAEAGLHLAAKRDSQEVCFIPSGDYRAYLAERAAEAGEGARPGDLVDETGAVVGTHPGVEGFTVGQRRGLGVALGERRFVTGVDPATGRVAVGPESALWKRAVAVEGMRWVSGHAPAGTRRVQAKLRYGGEPARALAEPGPDGTLTLHFEAPQRAPTPGQAAVLYDGERVLGGGTIAQALD